MSRPDLRVSQTTWRLGFLFGAIYFIQGIGEPTEGLVAQPVRSLLKGWGHGAGSIGTFAAILAIPWSLKPLYGLLSDFAPLFGSRRRAYLIATSLTAIVGFLVAWLIPISADASRWLLVVLLVPTVAVAFNDVVADALMVEVGQPLGITGALQAVQWGSMYAATILAGWVGGYLSQHGWQRYGFLICGAASFVTLWIAADYIREPAGIKRAEGPRIPFRLLRNAIRSPTLLSAAAFLFFWNFNPFQMTVVYLYMTKTLDLGEQFYGSTISLIGVGSIAACAAYGLYCRRVPLRRLIHLSIALGVASTLAYWGLTDRRTAVLIALLVGFIYMTATLIQLDLAARVCPPEVAGTVFAILMSIENLSMALSTWLGGVWYESIEARWGSPTAFRVLVGVGAAFTAACWLIMPRVDEGKGERQEG